MRTSHINFAPHSVRRDIYQVTPLTLLLLCIALTLVFYAAYRAQGVMIQTEDKRNALASVQKSIRTRSTQQSSPTTTVIAAPQAAAVNAAIAQLNLPWHAVFNAVEAATPKQISLLTLEPDARKSTVRGSAEAKSSDEMIAYIEQLKKQGFFVSVVLTRHEINEQDPNRPLRFQFDATWGEIP